MSITNANTVESFLNDTVLRADWPKMSDAGYEFAIRLAAAVGAEMSAEPEDEDKTKQLQQFFVSFDSMRRAAPRSVLHDVSLFGPRLMDFMGVINEVSGLSVAHCNEGLWFFDLRRRNQGEVTKAYLASMLSRVTRITEVEQFSEPDHDEEWEDS